MKKYNEKFDLSFYGLSQRFSDHPKMPHLAADYYEEILDKKIPPTEFLVHVFLRHCKMYEEISDWLAKQTEKRVELDSIRRTANRVFKRIFDELEIMLKS